MKIKMGFSLCLLFQLFNCTGMAPVIDTFYVNKGVLQYFVNPTSITGESGRCTMDFTFRRGAGITAPVICNFTISTEFIDLFSNENVKTYFVSGNDRVFPAQIESILFLERTKKRVRYTSFIERDAFFDLIEAETLVFVVEVENEKIHFDSTKKLLTAFHHTRYEMY